MSETSILRMKLERYSHARHETRGILSASGITIATIESPWRDNVDMDTCIPLGTYRVVRTGDTVGDWGWMVVGVPRRASVALCVPLRALKAQGDINLCEHCHGSSENVVCPDRTSTLFHLNRLTEGLSSFTLEIRQKLPYTDYVAEHGLVSLMKEEII